MRVINEYPEAVLLLEFDDLVEDSHRTGHTENALGDEKDTSAAFLGLFAGSRQNLLTVNDIVVAVLVLAADVETDSVKEAGVSLSVIDDHIVTGGKAVDRGDDSLIAEVEQERVLLLLEISEHPLKFLVQGGVAGKHTASHWIGQSPLSGALGVSLAHLRMVSESEIVVQTPVQDLFPVECHMRAKLALKFRIHIIAEALIEILSDRTA